MTPNNSAKQLLDKLIRLLRFYGPADNRTVIDIDDDIGVIKYPVYRCFKPGDILGPYLIRASYLNGLSPLIWIIPGASFPLINYSLTTPVLNGSQDRLNVPFVLEQCRVFF